MDMTRFLLTTSLLIGFFLVGCASSYHVPPIIDKSKPYADFIYSCEDGMFCVFDRAVPHINPQTFNPSCSDTNGFLQSNCKSYYAIAIGDDPNTKTDLKERTIKRDALIEALISASQEATTGHQSGIQANQSSLDLLFKLATAGLTGAGSVAGAAGAQAFSAAATGTNAAGAAVSEEVYQKRLAGNINHALTLEQEAKLLQIRQNLATKDVIEYNVQRGISDVLNYHELGSFYKALEIANADIARQAIKKEEDNKLLLNTVNKSEIIKSNDALLYNPSFKPIAPGASCVNGTPPTGTPPVCSDGSSPK